MSRRVEHLTFEAADGKSFAVLEEMVELAPVVGQVGGVEDRTKNLLHLADMFADADLRTGFLFDVGRARKVVGVGVGLEHPVDRQTAFLRGFQDPVRRMRRRPSGRLVVVEDRIDHGGTSR